MNTAQILIPILILYFAAGWIWCYALAPLDKTDELDMTHQDIENIVAGVEARS